MLFGFGMRLTPLLDLASFSVTAGSGAFCLRSQSTTLNQDVKYKMGII
jgi:hypothetical protein